MYCTYITFYRGNKLPPFYIGYTSVANIENGYRGSVRSKKYKHIWRKEQRENPNLFRVVILNIYDNINDARNREVYIQKHFNAHKNPMYVNMSINGKNFNLETYKERKSYKGVSYEEKFGEERAKEIKQKISDANIGIKKDSLLLKNSTRENAKKAHLKTKGVLLSEDHKQKIGNSNKGRVITEEHKQILSNLRLGTKLSNNTKEKIGASIKEKIKNGTMKLTTKSVEYNGIRFNSLKSATEFYSIEKGISYNTACKKIKNDPTFFYIIP